MEADKNHTSNHMQTSAVVQSYLLMVPSLNGSVRERGFVLGLRKWRVGRSLGDTDRETQFHGELNTNARMSISAGVAFPDHLKISSPISAPMSFSLFISLSPLSFLDPRTTANHQIPGTESMRHIHHRRKILSILAILWLCMAEVVETRTPDQKSLQKVSNSGTGILTRVLGTSMQKNGLK